MAEAEINLLTYCTVAHMIFGLGDREHPFVFCKPCEQSVPVLRNMAGDSDEAPFGEKEN